jgi:hypothetical protein
MIPMASIGCVLEISAAEGRGIEVLSGRWVYAGDDAEGQRRLDAIEATVRQMSWVARGMARKRIRASTPIHEWYEFRFEDRTVTIVEAGGDAFSTPGGGRAFEVPRSQGGPATLTRTWDDGALRSHWRQKKGEGTELYRVSEDGMTMKVTVIIASKRLPSDVVYELTYRRLEK